MTTYSDESTTCTNAEYTHIDNGGAARDWKVLSMVNCRFARVLSVNQTEHMESRK